MANNPRGMNERIITKIKDEKGRVIFTTEYVEEMTGGQGGPMKITKEGENTTLASGECFHPGMAAGAKPVMLIGTCSSCRQRRWYLLWRRPKGHGLCNVKQLKTCHACGKPVCPRHRRSSTDDRHSRCIRCHRWHLVRLALRAIFYERVDS